METTPIERFCKFLKIRTISSEGPAGSYRECVNFIASFCKTNDLDFEEVYFVENKPIAIIKLAGSDPSLPSVLLNGHYDVVPFFEEFWDTDAFEPTIRDGKIFARGTQDMKCVCMQYLEAIVRFRDQKKEQKRNIFITLVPDEEIGGVDGVGYLVQSDKFKAMNVGVVLDEGLANPEDALTVFYGERRPFWFHIDSTGPTGHASRFINNTAIEKLIRVVNKIYAFRAEQESKLKNGHEEGNGKVGCSHALAKKLGDVVTINLTALSGGAPGPEPFRGNALNVIPNEASAGFDMRVPPGVSTDQIKEIMQSWIAEEEGVTFDFHIQTVGIYVTSIDENENKWWGLLSKTISPLVSRIDVEIFPAATDCRYFREVGIPSFGFSPMSKTPVLLHDHNEFIGEAVYLKGIDTYVAILEVFANAD